MNTLNEVTPLSKYLALALFIALPFVGGWVGYKFSPEEIILKEKETEPHSFTKGHIATTTINQGEYLLTYNTYEISVQDKETWNTLQKIPWEVASFADYVRTPDLFTVTNRDINYDHYLDVGVLVSVGYGGANLLYEFYVFNPKTRTLGKELSLGENEFAVSNPSFDIAGRKIISSMRGTPYNKFTHTEYIFENGTYRKGKTWSETASEI